MWEILFYNDKAEADLASLEPKLQSRMIKLIDKLKMLGNGIEKKFSKCIDKDLYELRAKAESGIARAFYTYKNGKIIIILSVFVKKSQKTPKNEIEKARQILKELK